MRSGRACWSRTSAERPAPSEPFALLQSKPDGCTILLGTNGISVINPALNRSLGYDPVKDFEPISLVVRYGLILAVDPSLPFTDLKSMLEYARKNPGKLTYGSSGIGSISHLAGQQIASMAGVELTHVPYTALPQGLADLLAGRISIIIHGPQEVIEYERVSKVRLLGITSPDRLEIANHVPSTAEALPGYDVSACTILPRCRSPWPRRIRPSCPRLTSSGRSCRSASRAPVEFAHLRRCEQRGVLAQCSAVLIDILRDGRDPRFCRGRLRVPVQSRDREGEPLGQPVAELAAFGNAVERLIFIETHHFDSPFDRLALAADGKTAVTFACDRDDSAIEPGRKAPVDVDLGRAGDLALLQCRIIQKRKLHRALYLQRQIIDQKDGGCVRIEPDHPRTTPIGRRISEKCEDFFLQQRLSSRCVHVSTRLPSRPTIAQRPPRA